jgi:hypothetical protein
MLNLTPYAATCLKLFLARFPQFEACVQPFEKYLGGSRQEYIGWQAELPWPSDWEAVGLGVRARLSIYGETFRVLFGNSEDEYWDFDHKGSFEHLVTAFKFIDDVLDENLVLLVM